MRVKADKLEGRNLYRLTVSVEGKPDFTIELRADDEWKARTEAMVFYPYDLSGQDVHYTVSDLSEDRMDDEDLCDAVAKAINKRRPERLAQGCHTGGGIYCVALHGLRAGSHWLFGMSSEMWGGDYYATDQDWDESNYNDVSAETQVASDSQDVAAIAAAILEAIKEQA